MVVSRLVTDHTGTSQLAGSYEAGRSLGEVCVEAGGPFQTGCSTGYSTGEGNTLTKALMAPSRVLAAKEHKNGTRPGQLTLSTCRCNMVTRLPPGEPRRHWARETLVGTTQDASAPPPQQIIADCEVHRNSELINYAWRTGTHRKLLQTCRSSRL